MFHQSLARTVTLAAVLCLLAWYGLYGGFFAREIVIEIAVLAILAIALDLVAGFGGMVSLMHGALMGVAAYGFAALSVKLGWPSFPAAMAGIALTTLLGTAVAAVTSRTAGIFFIMATLAFGQMAYTAVFQWRWLGGDDGLAGVPRYDLTAIGLDLGDSRLFALFSVLGILFAYVLAAALLRSGFGRTLSGIHANEPRMRALGVTTWAHKTLAFAASSVIAGVAGVLAAQHTQFVSPELLTWTVSGEVLIIVILGGLGTLVGPVVGAAIFVLLKHEISGYTDHWHIVVGAVLIATVLAGGRGLYGQSEHWLARARRRRRPQPRPGAAPLARPEKEPRNA